MIELLIRVPARTVINEDDTPAVYEAVRSIDGRWTGDPAHGTRPYDGYKLIVAKVPTDIATVESMIADLNLDWTVIAAKDKQGMVRDYPEADLLPFMPDKPMLDDEGNITGWERPAKAVVGRYAGSPEWVFQ